MARIGKWKLGRKFYRAIIVEPSGEVGFTLEARRKDEAMRRAFEFVESHSRVAAAFAVVEIECVAGGQSNPRRVHTYGDARALRIGNAISNAVYQAALRNRGESNVPHIDMSGASAVGEWTEPRDICTNERTPEFRR